MKETIEKVNYKYIFVVLTYRNTTDVCDLLRSIEEEIRLDYKVIIVDSFYDDETVGKMKHISDEFNAIFLSVPNKGYSFGNNCGIKYAIEHYNFEWLIVSNPDTVIKKFDNLGLHSDQIMMLAPDIRNLKNKRQNPMHKSVSQVKNRFVYAGSKRSCKLLIYIGIIFGKIKDFFTICSRYTKNKKLKKISVAHGSFQIFSSKIFDKIGLPYDESIFLFAEEMVVAQKLKIAHIPIFYTDSIKIIHKEDGSMRFRNDISEQLYVANAYVLEKYYGCGK